MKTLVINIDVGFIGRGPVKRASAKPIDLYVKFEGISALPFDSAWRESTNLNFFVPHRII